MIFPVVLQTQTTSTGRKGREKSKVRRRRRRKRRTRKGRTNPQTKSEANVRTLTRKTAAMRSV